MIAETLIAFSELMDDCLKRVFGLNEGIVVLQPVMGGNDSHLPDNKVHVFLGNAVRETAGGITGNRQPFSGNEQLSTSPGWMLNLHVMVAACFNAKQYDMALRSIAAVAGFLQANSYFLLPKTGRKIQVEPVSLASNELSNLWSIYGNQYYPSLCCLMRNILIDSDEIGRIDTIIR